MAYAAYWMSLKGEAPASPQIHHSGRSSNSYSTAGSYYGKSQPSRATPKLATQVSTGKPAQFETNTMAATVIDMSSAGSTFVDMTSAGARAAPKEMPKTAAVSQVKATVTSPAAGFTAVTKPKESPKGSAKSATATTTVKAEVPKVDTARPSKPTATAGNVSVQGKKEVTEIKVQAEIPPAAAKGAKEVDPFDALANILPSVGPAPVLPVYTGPEVVEHNIISETGLKCGERDSTLPPGYRFDDMPPVPADYKPKDVPKPLSTDEALDSLSFGFTSPAAPAAPKKQEVMTEMSATVPTVSVCPPPADKKAKMEKDDFSLESCLPAATATKAAPPVSSWKAPPADKTTKKVDTKPKTDGGDSMSLDALSALVDTLPEDLPKPDLPELRPEDIISEGKHKKEKGVFVGERDDSIAPEYRFKKEDLKKVPALKPEPALGTADALDFLSGDFMDSSSAPPAQKAPVVAVCPPANKFMQEKIPDDFSLEAATATKVESNFAVCRGPPAGKKAEVEKTAAGKDKLKSGQGDSFSLDALSALSDTLPADMPKPELPEVRPEDIVSEGKHKKEKGVFVGEREDSIAPGYRFNKEEHKKLPVPKPEPTMGTADALDFLSGGFSDSSSAPPAQKLEPTLVMCERPPPAVKAPLDTPVPFPVKKLEPTWVCERPYTRPVMAPLDTPVRLPVQPTMGTADALDFLSGGFSDSSSAPPAQKLEPTLVMCERPPPAVKAPLDTPVPFPVKKLEPTWMCERPYTRPVMAPLDTPVRLPVQTKVEDLSALDMLSEDFVSTTKASGVQAPAPPATKKKTPERTVCPLERPNKVDVIHVQPREPKPKTDKGDSFSLDALSALSDTLPKDLPKPELSKLRPEDIISEDKHKKEKGVFVGERDDSIPPEYRFNEEESKKRPAPKPEPSINTGDALDFLSGDFAFSSSAPVVQAPVITPSAPPAQPSADFALDALAEEFVSSRAASTVKSSACAPTESSADLAAGADNALEALDALDALSDTLKDITPVPMPAPVPTKDLVNEEKLKEERLIKMGERDDTLPPEYRPTGDIGKVPAQPKPKGKSMDDKTALDLLSSDFSAAASLPVAPVASGAATTKLEPPVLDSEPLKPMAGAVLDTLSSTLLPDAPEFIPKSDKPKGKSKSKSKSKKHHAEEPHSDQLPAPPSSDVVPKSTRKGGRS
ncbi:calpastatin isoform X10 [Gymnodraco acuticeps]|uniref:Calpastatin n=1 Tax=Gymnodraco acuticeps TaxID=8218 RepID=A0A6P8VWN8_GYMAC|nr:calpastatin isoform X10 [Gymnodraco acuticeps]